MRKALKIIAIIFLILIIIVGSLVIWQWDNVKSVYIGLKESHEQSENRRMKNQTSLVDDINKLLDEPVRELTEEEKKQIEDGSIALSEIYAKIFRLGGSTNIKAAADTIARKFSSLFHVSKRLQDKRIIKTE